MKTVTMTTDPPTTSPEENKTTKLLTPTDITVGLQRLKNSIRDAIAGAIFAPLAMAPVSIILFSAAIPLQETRPGNYVFGLFFGSLMGLIGAGGGGALLLSAVKLRKQQKLAIPQATTEVSSWLKESYEVKVSDAVAFKVAGYMSIANSDSRTWKRDFEDETGKVYLLRCNPEGLFYIENADGQALSKVSESLEGIALYSTSAALKDTDTQLLESIQSKANSLLTGAARIESKTAVEQVTSEALKAVELNEQLVKLIPNSTNEALSSTLQILDTELDGVLQKEATAITREMERQNLYVQSRQQPKGTSKLKLNS